MKIAGSFGLLVLFAARLFAADATIEFRGVMAGGGPTKLSLVDKSNDTTQWVEIGKTFAGFTVKAYDPSNETVTLLKDGRELRLRLNAAKIADNQPEDSAAKSPQETSRAVLNNLRQIATAASQYYLESGADRVELSDLVGPEKYLKQLNPVDGEDYRALQLKQGNEPLTVKTAHGQILSYWPYGEPEPLRPPVGEFTFNVHAGDTAVTIARDVGLSVQELQAMNPGVNWSKLKIGQTLKVGK